MSKVCSNFSINISELPGTIWYAQQGVQYHVDRKEEGNLISRADWDRLRAHFRSVDWSSLMNDCPQQSCKRVTQAILDGMHQYIPSKLLTTSPSDPPWWTPECSEAMNVKDSAWKRWQRHSLNDELKSKFVMSVNNAVSVLRRAQLVKEAQVRNQLRTGSLRDKQWWSTIKYTAGEGRSTDIPVLITGNTECHTAKEKANCLADLFASKCSLGDADLSLEDLPQSESCPHPPLTTIRCRASKVRRSLASLVTSKVTGPDGISARVLKECSVELSSPLAKLFSLCFRSGVQPSEWKLANIVPIHKRSSHSKPSNYRPVSLLSIISKVMEGIINSQLVNYLETHQVLPASQFGFRRGHGCADLLTALQHEWSHAMGEGGHTQVIAVDIAGAFDRVSHAGVLHKAQQAGVGGSLLNCLKAYLTDRYMQVVIDGHRSAPHPIQAGVPQGSILDPTLFILYVSDIDQCLSPGSKLATFADDTTLYSVASHADVQQSTASLQTSLDKLHEWGCQWRIKFEPSKTQRMIISRRHTVVDAPSLTFGGVPIQTTDCLKLLGINFDSSLSFRVHVHNIAVRANQRLGFLRKASRVLDVHGRLTVYKGFVRPYLEYSPLTWMCAAPSHLLRLDRVQRKAMRLIGPGILMQSLSLRRMVAALCYIFKLHSMSGTVQLSSLLPPAATAYLNPRTRLQSQNFHSFQLHDPLPRSAPDYLRRSFPHSALKLWNSLPASLLHNTLTLNVPSLSKSRYADTSYTQIGCGLLIMLVTNNVFWCTAQITPS